MVTSNVHSASTQHSRRFVVGDVHGHYDAVVALLDYISPASQDKIYFLGDLIDRGQQSRTMIDFVRREGYTTLIGNHEQMLIDSFTETGDLAPYAFHSWLNNGGETTFISYQENVDALWDDVLWIKKQPYFADLGSVWLVHAGLHPCFPLEEQTSDDLCWIRDIFHTIEKPYFPDKLIITGHTITFTFPQVEPGHLVQGVGWLDIDTGAYHPRSGWLTAIDPDQQQAYQYNVYTEDKRTLPLAAITQTYQPRQRQDAAPQPLRWPTWFAQAE